MEPNSDPFFYDRTESSLMEPRTSVPAESPGAKTSAVNPAFKFTPIYTSNPVSNFFKHKSPSGCCMNILAAISGSTAFTSGIIVEILNALFLYLSGGLVILSSIN